MATYHPNPTGTRRVSLLQVFAALVGIVFLLAGVGGFIPGITTDYSELRFAGPDSEAMLLGVFQVSMLHNLIHLLFGVIGLALARTATTAMVFLVGSGLIYLLLWIFGLSIDHGTDANFVPVNTADDWLHFGLGVGMLALALVGWLARGRQAPAGPPPER